MLIVLIPVVTAYNYVCFSYGDTLNRCGKKRSRDIKHIYAGSKINAKIQHRYICVYFAFYQYHVEPMVIHSDCICGKTIKLAAMDSTVQYACSCGRRFDIRVVTCTLCGNFCAGIFRPGMSPSDMCRVCGIDHRMTESVLTILPSGLGAIIRKNLILRLVIFAAGIGLLIGLINTVQP